MGNGQGKLFALVVGGSLELVMNGPTGRLYHHVGLYGYVVAWLAALVLAYKPIFRGAPTPSAPTSRRQLNSHASRASLPLMPG